MKAEWKHKVNLMSETNAWSLVDRRTVIEVESCATGLYIGVYDDNYEGSEVVLNPVQVSVLHKLLGIYLETEDLPINMGNMDGM